jgi:hypothetical protein
MINLLGFGKVVRTVWTELIVLVVLKYGVDYCTCICGSARQTRPEIMGGCQLMLLT